MSEAEHVASNDPAFVQAAEAKVQGELTAIAVRTDRMFVLLMALQWLAAVATALWLSPRAWSGMQSSIHIHLWAALILGGALSGLPIYLGLAHPGSALTRQVIAVAQALWSALLIHLTGGRIETHFHVFGSLAFLAWYRDWRVLLTATVVVAADHLLRGAFWAESAFGVLSTSFWRPLEHAGWVVFEDAFLCWSLRQSLLDMHRIALNQVHLEHAHELVEREVQLRTRELHDQINERIRAEKQLEQTHEQLLSAARRAGMAEVATGVLHNVGNVINSINVSCTLAADRMRKSRINHLQRAVELLEKHRCDLEEFLTHDPQGRQLPGFLKLLSAHLQDERQDVLAELDTLANRLEHMKKIVAAQQSYARGAGALEATDIARSLDDAVALDASSLEKRGIQLFRDYEPLAPVVLDRQKLLQILVNLIRNAKDALVESPSDDRRLIFRIRACDADRFQIVIEDNGVGIGAENLPRIFSHGFTTKPGGHGFGLHSSANVAREMGGSLSVHSQGPGCGASLTLELPHSASEAPDGEAFERRSSAVSIAVEAVCAEGKAENAAPLRSGIVCRPSPQERPSRRGLITACGMSARWSGHRTRPRRHTRRPRDREMLDTNRDQESLSKCLTACICEIDLLVAWRNFFDESGAMPSCAGDTRRFPRFYARGKGALECRQSLPGRPRPFQWRGIYTKNVSREGLGFLHSEQLFPRERMRVLLADGVPRAIEVACCRRIQRRCYEIGARFIGADEVGAASL